MKSRYVAYYGVCNEKLINEIKSSFNHFISDESTYLKYHQISIDSETKSKYSCISFLMMEDSISNPSFRSLDNDLVIITEYKTGLDLKQAYNFLNLDEDKTFNENVAIGYTQLKKNINQELYTQKKTLGNIFTTFSKPLPFTGVIIDKEHGLIAGRSYDEPAIY